MRSNNTKLHHASPASNAGQPDRQARRWARIDKWRRAALAGVVSPQAAGLAVNAIMRQLGVSRGRA